MSSEAKSNRFGLLLDVHSSRSFLQKRLLLLLFLLLAVVVHPTLRNISVSVRRSNRVHNHSNKENRHSRKDIGRIALRLQVVGGNHSEKHGRTKEKRNGAGQSITIGEDEHNQTKCSRRNTSNNRSANLLDDERFLRVAKNQSRTGLCLKMSTKLEIIPSPFLGGNQSAPIVNPRITWKMNTQVK